MSGYLFSAIEIDLQFVGFRGGASSEAEHCKTKHWWRHFREANVAMDGYGMDLVSFEWLYYSANEGGQT